MDDIFVGKVTISPSLRKIPKISEQAPSKLLGIIMTNMDIMHIPYRGLLVEKQVTFMNTYLK